MRWIARLLLILLIIGLLAYTAAALAARPLPEHAFFADLTRRPLVIAHQGGDGLRPSNTLAAFENAVALGADVLEMDIHSSADGVLVVIHDDTVDRTTDGVGRVHDKTYAELAALDAGYDWPTLAEEAGRTDRPFRGQGVTIPALEEVLRAFPDMPMNIEIKQEEPSIAGALCDLLRQYDREENTLVASFRPRSIQEFRAACPAVATSAVEPEIRPFFLLSLFGLGAAAAPPAQAFQVPEFGGGFRVVDVHLIRNARAKGVEVHPWTINTTEDMERMLALDVDGIITDYPDRLLALLGR